MSQDEVAPASRRRSPWPPAVLAIAIAGYWAWSRRPEPVDDREVEDHEPAGESIAPYEDAARTLLGELDHADPLAQGWTVERVEGPLIDGRIQILVSQDTRSFVVWVAPRGWSKHKPPSQTESWELFYDRAQPPGTKIDAAEINAVLEIIAARVRAHE